MNEDAPSGYDDGSTEHIVLSVADPIRVDVWVRVLAALAAEFPGARWVDRGASHEFVIEVDA